MPEYVRIKSGESSARMLNSRNHEFVEIRRCDESPGEGWYSVEKILPKPTPGPGQELGYTYTISNGVARKEYFVASPPRSLSKRKLMNALKAVDLWTAVKAYMEQNDIWDDFAMATTLDDDDPLVVQAVAALKAGMGLTDAQVESIMSASVAE